MLEQLLYLKEYCDENGIMSDITINNVITMRIYLGTIQLVKIVCDRDSDDYNITLLNLPRITRPKTQLYFDVTGIIKFFSYPLCEILTKIREA